jgi:hypothetical protein
MNYIFVLLFFVLLIGCNSNNAVHDIESTTIGYDDTLFGELLPEPILSKTPISIFISPYGLLGVPSVSSGVIQLIDTLTGKVLVAQYNIGKASDELLDPLGMDFNPENSTLCVWDISKQIINLYKVSEQGFHLFRTQSYSGIHPSVIRNASDSMDIILTSLPDQALLILNHNKIKSSVPYRILAELNLDYYNFYNPSEIDVSIKQKLIFAADPYLPYLAAFTFNNNQIEKLWEKMVFKPSYRIKNRWRWINDNNRGGFHSISVSNRFIYVPYYGVTKVEWEQGLHKKLEQLTLFVFDFDGNLVKTVLLDYNPSVIAVTPDDRVIYGLLERPDRYIVKFSLN